MRLPTPSTAAFLLATLVACAGAPALASAADDPLRSAIDSPKRSPENRSRDAARHPEETLRFFGITPTQHVLELWPGTGWYTEILAPLLAKEGKLTITNFDPNGPADATPTRLARELDAKLAADPATYGAVEGITVAPPEKLSLGADARYDLVLTFRNNHGWINGGYHDAVYREAFRVLKPGGVLGVVQHRAKEGADPVASAKTGYVPESAVIEAAQRAGFTLAARSEINANPKDTKDHPEGVWTLPPIYRLGERDRAKYEAIGESDRMTLRFVKPARAE
ncbi:MAG: methyltransferase domain-containing protein [Myxococcota bacterium]|nr:methyltransferase domain-containing protein [Myxococcota bacterium]